MRTRYKHRGTVLSGGLRPGDQTTKLTRFLQVEGTVVSGAVHIVIPMQSLPGRTGPDIESQADAQERVDGVLFDDVFADDAEPLFEHGSP